MAKRAGGYSKLTLLEVAKLYLTPYRLFLVAATGLLVFLLLGGLHEGPMAFIYRLPFYWAFSVFWAYWFQDTRLSITKDQS